MNQNKRKLKFVEMYQWGSHVFGPPKKRDHTKKPALCGVHRLCPTFNQVFRIIPYDLRHGDHTDCCPHDNRPFYSPPVDSRRVAVVGF